MNKKLRNLGIGSVLILLFAVIVYAAPCFGQGTCKADLIVSDIEFGNATNITNSSDFAIKLFADIENIGNATAQNSTTRFRVTPGPFNEFVFTPRVPAGQTRTVDADFELEEGCYNATVWADWFDVVDEWVENNNVRKENFCVP